MQPYLAGPLQNLTDNLSALREFVQLIEPVLADNIRDLAQRHCNDLIPYAAALSSLYPHIAGVPPLPILRDKFGTNFDIEVDERTKSVTVRVGGTAAPRFQRALKLIERSTSHHTLLYKSALVSLVSAVEFFTAQLIRADLVGFPSKLSAKDKLLGLEDLESFASIEDARQYLIDLKIDEVMRGSLDDWLRFMRESMSLSMGYIDPIKNKLIEIFQRRNVIVHNNGVVHSSYIKKVHSDLRNEVSVGSHLAVDAEYVTNAVDLVEVAFTLICAELWKQWDPENKARSKLLNKIAFDRLLSERWVVAEGLSYFVMNDKKMPERDRIVGQLN